MEILNKFLSQFDETIKAIMDSDNDDYGKLLQLKGFIFGTSAVGYNGTKAAFSMLEKGYDNSGYGKDIENAVKRELSQMQTNFNPKEYGKN